MSNIILKPEWQLKENQVTDKSHYENRRSFVKKMGLGSISLTMSPLVLSACNRAPSPTGVPPEDPLDTIPKNAPRHGLPAPQNAAYQVSERELTDRISASSYNNFYEFDGSSKKVWHLTGSYNPFPWTIKVEGLVEKELQLDIEALIKEFTLEERIYRFRCVEAWAMTVPWSGFPLKKLIEKCKPLSKATHVQFVSTNRPNEMPGIPQQHWYQWPYYEALRLDEATNDLAFVATGLYGEPLPKQNGSPLRLALPWKYGYKGPKAIEKIIFMDKQPHTFWNDLQPDEYGFLSNVNPHVPHPRWSQATEKLLPNMERVPTKLFNGYANWVGSLYPNEPKE